MFRRPRGGGGIPILDLTGCAAQQGVLLRQNYATECPFLIKLMRQGITIDKKIMRQGITIDKKIMRQGIMWKDAF